MIKRLNQENLLIDETLFTVANGYIGMRGCFEEGYEPGMTSYRGTYLNGFYDTHTIKYSESAYGFPTIGETMVNVIDGQTILLYFDDEQFKVEADKVFDFDRSLDVKKGVYTRRVGYVTRQGKKLVITFKRLAAFDVRELVMIHAAIESIDFKGKVRVESFLRAPQQSQVDPDDPRVAVDHVPPLKVTLDAEDSLSALTGNAGHGMQAVVWYDQPVQTLASDEIKAIYTCDLIPGQKQSLTKYMVYTDSLRYPNYKEKGQAIKAQCQPIPFEGWLDKQAAYLKDFWASSAIEIEGEKDLEQALSFSMYHLFCSAGLSGKSQIAAKGLTGAGYEGHYFWDTEIYCFPMFLLSHPQKAKHLLEYRHMILKESRVNAQQLGHHTSAKIPWRTISGRECSSYFPAGAAQYHINADVAYSIIQYYLLTKDVKTLEDFAFETLVETAKLWLDVGHYRDGAFMIHNVTGPDEYSAVVDNNFYTNAMAKYHLTWVVNLSETYPQLRALISGDVLEAMKSAATNMYLPYDQALGIHKQDEGFLNKPKWDFEKADPKKYPLLLHYHPLVIYRHQVLKQADTVLAHFLLDDFDPQVVKASYDYYEALTTHDSSLSPCVYGLMAAKTGDADKAYAYFMDTVYLDLHNLHHNTKDGMHIANAGGAYMAIPYGFGGLRIKADGVHLWPTKPKAWPSYTFRLGLKEAHVRVRVGETITITTDTPVSLKVYGKDYLIEQEVEVVRHDT